MNLDSHLIFESYFKNRTSVIKEEPKLDPIGKEDADVNNDGKVDETDKVIMARRNAIADNIAAKKAQEQEETKKMENGIYQDALYIWDYLLNTKKYSPSDAIKIIGLAKTSFEHLV